MTEREKVKSFLGTGFHFPIEVEEATGRMKDMDHSDDPKGGASDASGFWMRHLRLCL